MPLHKLQTIIPHISCYGIWKIEEGETDLHHVTPELLAASEGIAHDRKRIEFITSRQLVEQLCYHLHVPFTDIRKDEYGKPFLDGEATHISLAHSYPYVCAMAHRHSPCGIDVEQQSAQVMRVKGKFMSEEELQWADQMPYATLVWSAKETLYKIYGRKRLIFKENMKILPPENENFDRFIAKLTLEGETHEYTLGAEKVADFWITYLLV